MHCLHGILRDVLLCRRGLDVGRRKDSRNDIRITHRTCEKTVLFLFLKSFDAGHHRLERMSVFANKIKNF